MVELPLVGLMRLYCVGMVVFMTHFSLVNWRLLTREGVVPTLVLLTVFFPGAYLLSIKANLSAGGDARTYCLTRSALWGSGLVVLLVSLWVHTVEHSRMTAAYIGQHLQDAQGLERVIHFFIQ